jgi:hypothetical protein
VFVDDGAHHPSPIAEVVLDSHRVLGSGLSGDFAQADAVDAVGGEELLGRGDDGQPGRFGVASQWTASSLSGYVGQQLVMQLH